MPTFFKALVRRSLWLILLVPFLTACPFEDDPPRPTGDALLQFTSQQPVADMPIAKAAVKVYFAESFASDYLVGSTDSLGNVTYDSVLTFKAPMIETETDDKGKVLVKDFNNANYIYHFDNGKKQKLGGFQITADKTRIFVIDLDK